MKPILCFDVDNTLIRSDKAHIKAFNMAFKKANLPKVKNEKIAKLLTGILGKEIIKKLFPKLKKEQIKRITLDHNKFVIKKTHKYATPIRGTVVALKKLKKEYKIVLITNCTRREILTLLKSAGITSSMYDIVIGKDEVKHAKPSPEAIFKAEKLAHHKALFMIGDSILDVKAGKKAKVKTIAVLTGHNTWKELKREKPTIVVKSVSHVPKAIELILKKR